MLALIPPQLRGHGHSLPAAYRDAGSFLRLLWRSSRPLFVINGCLTVLLGLLPNLILLATSRFAGSVPEALRHGLDTAAGRHAEVNLALLALAFAASGVTMSLARLGSELLNSRFVRTVSVTVTAACLRPDGIAELEDPGIAGELAGLRDFERSGLNVQAILAARIVVSQRIAGLGAAVILLKFQWWAPLMLAAAWLIANIAARRWMEDGFAPATAPSQLALRQSDYYYDLAVGNQAAKELRIFELGGWFRAQHSAAWLSAMSQAWQSRRTGHHRLAGGVAAIAVAYAVLLLALSLRAIHRELSVTALTAFVLAAIGTEQLGFLGDPQWRAARAAALATELLRLQQRLTPQSADAASVCSAPAHRAAATPRSPAEVRLEDVEFRYPSSDRSVLRTVNLHIPAGQSVAIVGENGAGKSTLIKLLCGLYQPQAGRVLVDGRSLADGHVDEIRERIAVIFQDFIRYELPLRENVAFGCLHRHPSDAELQTVLSQAGGAQLAASLPLGWDTVLGRGYEGGADLSGGQWQQVALARALVAVRAGGAGLLILDEPAAALDVRAEQALFDRFLQLASGLTSIIVSHRLSSVRYADRIVVLSDGKVTEDGSHAELIAAGGGYAQMFKLQARRFATS